MSAAMQKRTIGTKAPSRTKYLVFDSSKLLRETRESRMRQAATIRSSQARRYNDELKRAIATALTTKATPSSR